MNARLCIVTALLVSASTGLPVLAQELVIASPATEFALDSATFIPLIFEGDFDEDGETDVILIEGAPLKQATVLLGQPSGGFAPGPVSSLSQTGVVMLTADLDGDGHLDLLGTGAGFGSEMALAPGVGDGSFSAGIQIPAALTWQYASLATAGDLDLDGDLDVVATRTYAQVLRNGGDGTFTSDGTLSGQADAFLLPRAITLADLANDGTMDLVVGMSNSLQRVHAGLPGGSLSVTPELVSVGTMPTGTEAWSYGHAVADLDGDGVLDLAQTHTGDLSVQVRPGLGDGTFGPVVTSPYLTPPSFSLNFAGDLRLADWDGDGIIDLAALVQQRSEVHFLRGLGGGAFEPSNIVSTLSPVRHAVVMDLDKDGRDDLLGTRQAFGLVTVPDAVLLRNATYAAAEPFVDLGDALQGTRGYPVMLAQGSLMFAEPFSIRLENGPVGAQPFLVVGIAALEVPLKGGVLWPQTDFVVPVAPVDAEGVSSLQAIWLESVGGYDVWFQYWFADAGAPSGFAATTGVRASVP